MPRWSRRSRPGRRGPGWFSTSGNQIVDSAGHSVQIAGVNWFGFESSNLAPHGLWTRGYQDMMNQMKDLGFNTIRLPFSNDTIHSSGTPNGIDFSQNPDLQGLTAMQIMDKIVAYAGEIGLKIILDHHRNDSGPGASSNGLWYDAQHPESQWISDWQMLATRYAGNPTVIGADLHNEPHAGTWGGGGPTDWARPNATLASRPVALDQERYVCRRRAHASRQSTYASIIVGTGSRSMLTRLVFGFDVI